MVITEAGVSRSTGYRAWENKEAFETALLCDLAGPSWQDTAAFDEETIKLAQNTVAENLPMLATPEGRHRLTREVIRVAARRNYEAVAASPQWRTYVALSATVLTMNEESGRRESIHVALSQAERTFTSKMTIFYERMGTVLGLRVRDADCGYDRITGIGAAVVEGLGLRQLLTPDIVNTPITIQGPDGLEEWTLAAWGFYAIICLVTEPDPNYHPQVALGEYLKALTSESSRDQAGP